LILVTAHHQNSGRSLWPLGLDLELKQPGNIFQDFFSVHVVTVNFKEIVRVNVPDLSDVQVVLKTMIGNVLVFIVDNVAIENLLSGFEFLFAVAVHSGLVHVDNDEGVWEDTGLLHGEALGAGFGEARENEAFLLFLNGFDLLFDKVDNDLIFDERELFEIAFDLLSEL
jgi:hypothetical protein